MASSIDRSVGFARELLRFCLIVERSQIAWSRGLRCALTMAVILLAADHWGQPRVGVPLSLGVLFANLCDINEPHRLRLQSMLWVGVWSGVATALAGLVESSWSLHLALAFCLAGVVGYASLLGPKSSLIGSICLAMFAIYSGAKIGSEHALIDGLLVMFGSLIASLRALIGWPFHRFGATRRKLAIAYDQFHDLCHDAETRWATTGVASAILDATRSVDQSGAAGPTEVWLRSLLACLDRSRVVMFAIESQRANHPDTAALDRVLSAVGDVAGGIANALMRENRRRQLADQLARLDEACDAFGNAPDVDLIERVRADMQDAARRILDPWPIGSAAVCAPIKDTLPTVSDRLRQHVKPNDLFVTHGIKLAITFTLASGLSLLPWNHSTSQHAYWIPLTVAWICKPDLGGTISKVGMRMVGSALGVLMAVVALQVIGTDDGIILIAALGALLTVAFLWANYTLTVIGITMVVLCLGALTGSPLGDEAWVRMWATLVGGLLVVVTSIIRPVRNGTAATGHLNRLCAELRGYVDALKRGMRGDELRQIRQGLLQARTVASATLAAAAVEPAGFGQKDSIRIRVQDARAILHDLEGWLSSLAHVDLTAAPFAADATIWTELETSITAIERRIANLNRPA
jgi:uncharacterized membrane protein YccC